MTSVIDYSRKYFCEVSTMQAMSKFISEYSDYWTMLSWKELGAVDVDAVQWLCHGHLAELRCVVIANECGKTPDAYLFRMVGTLNAAFNNAMEQALTTSRLIDKSGKEIVPYESGCMPIGIRLTAKAVDLKDVVGIERLQKINEAIFSPILQGKAEYEESLSWPESKIADLFGPSNTMQLAKQGESVTRQIGVDKKTEPSMPDTEVATEIATLANKALPSIPILPSSFDLAVQKSEERSKALMPIVQQLRLLSEREQPTDNVMLTEAAGKLLLDAIRERAFSKPVFDNFKKIVHAAYEMKLRHQQDDPRIKKMSGEWHAFVYGYAAIMRMQEKEPGKYSVEMVRNGCNYFASYIENMLRPSSGMRFKSDGSMEIVLDGFEPELEKTQETKESSTDLAAPETEDLSVESFMSSIELAKFYHVPPNALRQRLEKWRKNNFSSKDWKESQDTGRAEAKFLYKVSTVLPIIKSLMLKTSTK